MTFLIVTVAWAAHTRYQLGQLQLSHLDGVTGSYMHSQCPLGPVLGIGELPLTSWAKPQGHRQWAPLRPVLIQASALSLHMAVQGLGQ